MWIYIEPTAVISSGSSVSIVSDYRLANRAIGVQSPAEAKYFSSSLCVQTGSEAHPASYPMGTVGPSPGVKRGRGVTLTTHLYIVSRSRKSGSYTHPPLAACMAVTGQLYRYL
jgi:hypothetical protein